MQLTKEHFDKQLSRLAAKADLKSLKQTAATKNELKSAIKALQSHTDTSVDRLARIIAQAFQAQQEFMDARFKEIRDELDTRSQMHTLKKRLERVEAQLSHR